MPSAISSIDPDPRRTGALPSSYVIIPNAPDWPLAFSDPPSMFIFARPRRKLRRKITARKRANAYSALLQVDDYSEQARDALRAGDDSGARHCLAVIRAIVEVTIAQLSGAASDCPALQ